MRAGHLASAQDVVMEDRFRVSRLDDLGQSTGHVHKPSKALLAKVGYAKTDGNSVAHGRRRRVRNSSSVSHGVDVPRAPCSVHGKRRGWRLRHVH